MAMFEKQGSPFLFDEDTKDIVALRDPDGSYTPILTPPEVMAARRGIPRLSKPFSTSRAANPVYANAFIKYPRSTNPETITYTQGPSVASGATINTEYNSLKSGKKEIAFRTDADRVSNGALLASIMFEGAFVSPVSVYASILSAYPLINSTGLYAWNGGGGITFTYDSDWIALVYGDNTTSNSAEIYVDGQMISGSTAGVISNAIGSANHSPQWTTLQFADKRRRVVTLVKSRIQAIIVPTTAQISPAPLTGKAMVFGDSNSIRALTTGESTQLVRRSIAADALESLGYSVTNAGIGGTGFVDNGGGFAAGKANYSTVMDWYIAATDPTSYSVVWLFGTGNDDDNITSASQYAAVINKALAAYTNATIIVTGVYEGFNPPVLAETLNALLYQAILSVNSPRVLWIPTTRARRTDGTALWFGTGCVANVVNDGNADIYLGSIGSGTADRHANAVGCLYGANWFATQFADAGLVRQ